LSFTGFSLHVSPWEDAVQLSKIERDPKEFEDTAGAMLERTAMLRSGSSGGVE